MAISPRNIAIAAALGIGIILLACVGVIRSLDDWMFDRLVSAGSSMGSSQGVLVVAAERELSGGEGVDLASALKRQGARLVVIVQPSSTGHNANGREDLSESDAVVSADAAGLRAVPAPAGGIWRGIGAESLGEGQGAARSLTTHIASELDLSLPEGRSYLDFKIRRDGFQRVDAKRVLGGDLPPSLIEGKVVLVGKDNRTDALVSTPVHQGAEALSPLMFQAAVIDVLLRDGFVRIAPPVVQWGVAAVLAGVLAFVLRRRQLSNALRFTLAGAVLAVLASWLAISWFQWWLPPTKAVALLGAVGTVAAVSAVAEQRETLRRMLRSVAVDAQERVGKDGFLTTATPWPLAEKVLGQSFGFDSSFLLRADAQSGVLAATTEAGEAECGRFFSDASLRRDAEPFSAALDDRGQAFADSLVVLPIGSPAHLFGFWAFGPADPPAVDQARGYADRLAVMFERRESWRERARPNQLDEAGAVIGGRPLHDQLESSIELLDSGRKALADALDRSIEAVLVYDPFGKLSHSSRPSVELLGSAGVEFSESPAELLARLTGMGDDEIRRTLRYVALNRDEATFKASANLIPGREFFVHIRALAGATPPGGGDGTGLPGSIMLIEDVTQTARAALLKDEFVEHLYFQLNNDFEAILVASELLDDPRLELAERAELVMMINEKIEEAARRVKETRSHLAAEFSPGAVERYPIRFGPVFNAAKAAVGGELESRQVAVETSISEYLPLVLAGPKPLEDLFHAILLTLIHDAREESQISVSVVQGEGEITVRLKNQGFGMPQERLDRYLNEGDGGHETLDKIGAGLIAVGAWGGNLSVSSQVGSGMAFELKLVSVI